MPSIDAHSRLGVVERRQFDALGATAFICSCVGAFYDLYRQDRVSTASVVVDTIDDDDTRVAEVPGGERILRVSGLLHVSSRSGTGRLPLVRYLARPQAGSRRDGPGTRAPRDKRPSDHHAAGTERIAVAAVTGPRNTGKRGATNRELLSVLAGRRSRRSDASIRIETDSLEEWIEATVDTVDADPTACRTSAPSTGGTNSRINRSSKT